MIPPAYAIEWRRHAPWPSDEQVEQDLILSRVLVELYGEPAIGSALACEGEQPWRSSTWIQPLGTLRTSI